MEHTTLALAVLLTVGLTISYLGKKLKLPAVTCYILAGLLLGPSGFALISEDLASRQLSHFTQIALMLIAFGIGEHIEFKELKKVARTVGSIALAETVFTFILVGMASFLVTRFTMAGDPFWQLPQLLSLATLLAAVAMATAPASTLHVVRELEASGPLTSSLLAVVAINNSLAIMAFGMALALAGNLLASSDASFIATALISAQEIVLALLLGMVTGLAIDFVLHRLSQRGEMLSAGLALLLLCGESARLLDLSPLLAGMAAGATLINRDKRDVRLYRALHDFEPPIYLLFFTLAGSQLHISALGASGLIGICYFLTRLTGKIVGARLGARAANSPPAVRRYLGYALAPQAGVAIGLIFLISATPGLTELAAVITPVVLTGVVLSELIGPLLARFALVKAGEAGSKELTPNPLPGYAGLSARACTDRLRSTAGITITPWTWQKLVPPVEKEGVVLFGAAHHATVTGLARLATIFAHHTGADPMAVRVIPPNMPLKNEHALFAREEAEVRSMGYSLLKKVVRSDDVAQALSLAVVQNPTKGLIIGYPIEGTIQGFQKVVEQVAEIAVCPVIVVRFHGALHTERILVPLVSLDQLDEVSSVVKALSRVGEHAITLLYLLPYDQPCRQREKKEKELESWLTTHQFKNRHSFHCKVVNTESRQETIYQEAESHDLLVMGAPRRSSFQRLIFGSLAEAVSQNCQNPLLIVHIPPTD
ncbi:MAG: cation:proton antiporter [Deltaproteobacteria bacterium]|jgi:Kef-type K+ transport system membrane component KefB/nucleotide-binding universal stress UspA family protein|nr:cation:proton antiporter [Deltaproteobacteria bacterium]